MYGYELVELTAASAVMGWYGAVKGVSFCNQLPVK
jgi:hypothetical protein